MQSYALIIAGFLVFASPTSALTEVVRQNGEFKFSLAEAIKEDLTGATVTILNQEPAGTFRLDRTKNEVFVKVDPVETLGKAVGFTYELTRPGQANVYDGVVVTPELDDVAVKAFAQRIQPFPFPRAAPPGEVIAVSAEACGLPSRTATEFKLLYRADGTLDCGDKDPGKIPEFATVAPKVLARSWWDLRYVIDVAALGSKPGPFRGLASLAKAIDAAGKFVPSPALAAAMAAGPLDAAETATLEADQKQHALTKLNDELAEMNEVTWITRSIEKSPGEVTGFGPFSREKVRVTVEILGTKIAATQDFEIAHRYLFNVSVMTVFGPTKEKFKVSNGAIEKVDDQVPVELFAGLQIYPFRHNPCEGRFFERDLQSWNDKFGVIAGTSVTGFGEAAYLGLSYEVFRGVAVGLGWQPRKEQELKDGFKVGMEFTGNEAPTDKKWSLTNWGAAVSIDTDLIRSFAQ